MTGPDGGFIDWVMPPTDRPHFARPVPAPSGAPFPQVYAKPYTCRICGEPIELRKGSTAAWRHTKARS